MIRDLADIPANVKNGLEIIPVSRMDEVLRHALVRQPTAIEWDEAEHEKAVAAKQGSGAEVVAAH